MTAPFFAPAQQKNLEGYVGFANLPNQVYRKSVKRGFEFTLMVVAKCEASGAEQLKEPGTPRGTTTACTCSGRPIVSHCWGYVTSWLQEGRAVQRLCKCVRLHSRPTVLPTH
ncbi:hypothetical protein WMY93_020463 [Mugilogobius chulae]|uniref:Uncharacterized protein n=1 Tax=Mugilogobius chulae TaxID=88201 RepID=A0AAW0NH49_9GOBI